jgi:hypothetical protein
MGLVSPFSRSETRHTKFWASASGVDTSSPFSLTFNSIPELSSAKGTPIRACGAVRW